MNRPHLVNYDDLITRRLHVIMQRDRAWREVQAKRRAHLILAVLFAAATVALLAAMHGGQ